MPPSILHWPGWLRWRQMGLRGGSSPPRIPKNSEKEVSNGQRFLGIPYCTSLQYHSTRASMRLGVTNIPFPHSHAAHLSTCGCACACWVTPGVGLSLPRLPPTPF